MHILLFSFLFLNRLLPSDSLIIRTDNPYLNVHQDSILFLDVTYKNNSKSELRFAKIVPFTEGVICTNYQWDYKIIRNDTVYYPPLALCRLIDPYIIIGKSRSYHFVVSINFKKLYNKYNKNLSSNYDFGEYQIYFSCKPFKRDIIYSNKIRVFYFNKV